jgi:hypothetical protein
MRLALKTDNDDYDETKSFFIRTMCSMASSYVLNVSLPVSIVSNVSVSTLAISNPSIYEGSNLVWSNGIFNSIPGISTAKKEGNAVVFAVQSGAYSFSVTSTSASFDDSMVIHSDFIDVGNEFVLTCENGGDISAVVFASFAEHDHMTLSTVFKPGMGHVGSSKRIVEKHCLGKNHCSFIVNFDEFGVAQTPSGKYGLRAQALCSH